mgnify:CR=1 FL=1
MRKVLFCTKPHMLESALCVRDQNIAFYSLMPHHCGKIINFAARALAVNYTPDWIAENPLRFEALIDRSLRYRRRARGILAQINAVSRFAARERLADLTHAVLVLHGDADRLIPHPNGVRLAARLRNARFETLPGRGHLFWQMDDGQSSGMIRDFLANGG